MKKLITLCCIMASFTVSAQMMLNTLDGQKITLAQLAGKKIIVNYWAQWCRPCLDEIEALNQFYRKNQQKVALFAVNFDQPSLSRQRRAAKSYHIQYPSLAHDPARQLPLGEVRVVPATFILNDQGQLLKTLYGSQTITSLSNALNELN